MEELRLETVGEILASIEKAGRATGAEAQARALAANLRSGLDALRRRAGARPPVRVLYIIDRTPGELQGMFAAGPGSYIDELLTAAGGRNTAPTGAGAFPRLSLEQVLTADPDVIIDMGDYSHGRSMTPASRHRKLELWRQYPNLKAVRAGRVYDVSSDEFVVPGPRLVEAANTLYRLLHPGAP